MQINAPNPYESSIHTGLGCFLKILVFLTWSSVNLVKIKAGNYDTGGGSNLQDIEEKHGIVSDISIGYKNKYVLQ